MPRQIIEIRHENCFRHLSDFFFSSESLQSYYYVLSCIKKERDFRLFHAITISCIHTWLGQLFGLHTHNHYHHDCKAYIAKYWFNVAENCQLCMVCFLQCVCVGSQHEEQACAYGMTCICNELLIDLTECEIRHNGHVHFTFLIQW